MRHYREGRKISQLDRWLAADDLRPVIATPTVIDVSRVRAGDCGKGHGVAGIYRNPVPILSIH